MKTVNLEEILKKELIPIVYAGSSEMTFNATMRAMKEACRQTLELAAENADVIEEYTDSEIISQEHNVTVFDELGDLKKVIYADKQSILNTIKQIK